MATLETAVRQGIKILETITEIKFKDSTKKLRVWKGRKIIPLKKWESMRNRNDDQYKLLQYIPDDSLSFAFISETNNKALRVKREKWIADYMEFLLYTKNEAYGRGCCEGCILKSKFDIKSTSIRDVMLKAISEHEGEITFPCSVENIFECPHKQGKDNRSELFWLKEVWKIIHDALYLAHTRSRYDNQKTIQADFENNTAVVYEDQYDSGHKNNDLMHLLKRLSLSKILISEINDTYDVLTNSTKLDIVLEQYIESAANDYYSGGKKTPESEKKAESIRKYKNSILDFFTQIKDQIKLEDLHDIYDRGKTVRELDIEMQIASGQKKEIQADTMIRSGNCVSCGYFANINCIHCNIWICDKHWMEHGTTKHNMKFEEPIT